MFYTHNLEIWSRDLGYIITPWCEWLITTYNDRWQYSYYWASINLESNYIFTASTLTSAYHSIEFSDSIMFFFRTWVSLDGLDIAIILASRYSIYLRKVWWADVHFQTNEFLRYHILWPKSKYMFETSKLDIKFWSLFDDIWEQYLFDGISVGTVCVSSMFQM